MTGAGATVPGNTLAAPAGAGFSLRALSPPPMRPTRPLRIALALLTLVPAAFLGGCGTTRMEATWHGQDVGQLRFRSVLVVSLLQDEDYRRMSEAALRDAIKRVPVTTSFELVPVAADLKDRAAITKAIRERGIEGVVTMRLVDQNTRAVTGSPSAVAVASGQYSDPVFDAYPFYDFFYHAFDAATYFQSQRNAYADRTFHVEIRIFDVASGKLVWAGLSKTTVSYTRANDVRALVTDVADVLRSTLQQQGLVP